MGRHRDRQAGPGGNDVRVLGDGLALDLGDVLGRLQAALGDCEDLVGVSSPLARRAATSAWAACLSWNAVL